METETTKYMSARDIANEAIQQGACAKAEQVTNWETLVQMLFTPQGREFCEEKRFPSIDVCRDIRAAISTIDGQPVRIDAGEISELNPKDLAIVGDTVANLTYSGTDTVHKLIVMHGAKARVRASNYAVVLVVAIGDGCEVECTTDSKAVILK